MNRTPIDWVKNPDGTQGYTWNPITGCLNGCEYCYARKLANGRLKQRYLANRNHAPTLVNGDGCWQADPFYPRFWPERLDQPIYYEKPCGIFTVDMGELFGDWIPQEWQANVFEVIERCPQHRFYLLTKQPQNLIKFSPFPDNCWVGVTATDGEMYQRAMLWLAQIEAKVKYISFEPLLNGVQLYELPIVGLDWVIIGAQTKPYKPPKIEWIEEIVRACDKAGIPVFLKDNLTPLLRESVVSWKRDPHYLLGGALRQEMPI